jgi:phosphatidylinositol glycan class B
LALLITAIFSKGYYHFDEHFQILEFASLKLGHASAADMPWEYQYKMRSAIQPLIAVGVCKAFGALSITNPFLIAFVLRLMSALLAFAAICLLIKTFGAEVNAKRYIIWLLPLSFFLWFAVFNAVRFSSENWGAAIFAIALCLGYSNYKNVLTALVVGALLGFAFLFRFQVGFMIFGFLLWKLLIQKERFFLLVITGIGLLGALLAGVLIDKWFYGETTLSFVNYFQQNILLDKVSGFGLKPWWYYFFEVLVQGIPPFSLFFIFCVFLFLFLHPKHVLTFALVPFLLVHLLIVHKELRFLFPLIYFLPLMITICLNDIEIKWPQFALRSAMSKPLYYAFWICNCIFLLVIMFRPADAAVPLYETLYNNYPGDTRLYVIGDKNPYHRILDIHFYKRDNLQVISVDSVNQIELRLQYPILFATNNPKTLINYTGPHKLVYSSIPEWVRPFNYNNWQSRSQIWQVYRLN